MRFEHRRRQNGGELASRKGGFSGTPPQTPPSKNESVENGLDPAKGELGGFSTTLQVDSKNSHECVGYIHYPKEGVGITTKTPPEPSIFPVKPLNGEEKDQGGFLPETPPAPADRIGTSRGLPPEIIAGLRELQDRPPPSITKPGVWSEIVQDAVTLAADGWAGRAVGLGWDVLDVFGVGLRDSNEFEGLAVWLAGREVVAITNSTARTTCGATFYREAFGRPNSPRLPNLPLWQFGRR